MSPFLLPAYPSSPPPPALTFSLPFCAGVYLQGGGELELPIVRLKSVGFGYKSQPELFSGVDMCIDGKSRICLLGENGAGKTTLVKVSRLPRLFFVRFSRARQCVGAKCAWGPSRMATRPFLKVAITLETHKMTDSLLSVRPSVSVCIPKVIMDLLEPTSGVVDRNLGARVALVNQHHADQINLDLTPLHWMHQKFPGDGSYDHEQRLRSQLASCGVTATLQTTRAQSLSGGQRSRVALAAVSYEKPHLLIMDEPTNNLDLESVEALSQAVANFPGGVVLVSHDQTFVAAVAKEVWVVGGGTVRKEESFEAYTKKILKSLRDAA